MVMQCVFAICVLSVVIVGLLVMTQMISLEELVAGIFRCFLLSMSALVLLCLLKTLLLPILTSGLIWLKQMVLWILVIVIAAVTCVLLLRMLFLKLRAATHTTNTSRGNYE